MNEHPDLVGLVRGELTNAEATAAGDHLADCASCRDELVDTAVGHALLRRASVTVAGGAGVLAGPATAAAPVTLPPLAVVRRRPARRVLLAAGAAAAAVVLVAGGVAVGVLRGGDDAPTVTPPAPSTTSPTSPTSPGAPVGVDVALLPLEGTGTGEVHMVATDSRHTEMTLRTSDLPQAGAGQFYYAWLLDPATNKMLPLGQVGAWGHATFQLDDALLGAYSAVDVSLEDDDGDPEHSVTSVLRGSYAAGAVT